MAAATPIGAFPLGAASKLVDISASEGVSGVCTFEQQRSSCKRVYLLRENDGANYELAYNCVKDLLGYPEVRAGSGENFISRKTPHAIYRFLRVGATLEKRYFLFATKAEVKGLAPTDAGFTNAAFFPEYKQFKFEVTYETLPYDVLRDGQIIITTNASPDESYWQRYITKIAKPAGEFFTIPSGHRKWVTGAFTVSQGIGKLLSFCNLQVTWHQVPESGVPSVFVNPNLTEPSFIEKTIGKVNHSAFNGYNKGTLLLLGASMQPYRSPFGDRIYDITYMMKYMEPEYNLAAPIGHNFLFRSISSAGAVVSPGVWDEVTTSGETNVGTQADNISIYDWADFRKLFRAAP